MATKITISEKLCSELPQGEKIMEFIEILQNVRTFIPVVANEWPGCTQKSRFSFAADVLVKVVLVRCRVTYPAGRASRCGWGRT